MFFKGLYIAGLFFEKRSGHPVGEGADFIFFWGCPVEVSP